MKQQFFVLSLGVGALLLATQHAFSQTPPTCADHSLVVERLANRYGETRQSLGLTPNNAMLEIFASDETGTWTILVTTADGIACLAAAGQNFETWLDAPIKPGDDT